MAVSAAVGALVAVAAPVAVSVAAGEAVVGAVAAASSGCAGAVGATVPVAVTVAVLLAQREPFTKPKRVAVPISIDEPERGVVDAGLGGRVAGDERIPDTERSALDKHRRDGAAADLEPALDDSPGGLHAYDQ